MPAIPNPFKIFFCTVLAFAFSITVRSQSVAVSTDGLPASSNAMLDVRSSSKGILIPRIDYNNRPSTNVETGMLIFVTANGPQGNRAFYYYDGANWLRVKNNDDKQSLTLSRDTLKLSESNFVIVGNILNLIGYYKCGSSYVQTASDVNNCGSCGTVCSYPNAAASCANSSCVLGNCNTGFGNCNNIASDGCEINLTNNVNNCGSCGNVCALANAVASCASSTCFIAACNNGYANCNGTTSDGCEANVTNNVNNCGACGVACPNRANATAGCTQGVCNIASCNTGYANCNGNTADGCEVNLRTDVNNCGSCGVACPSGKSCVGGVCQ